MRSYIPFRTVFGVSNSFFGIALTEDVSHSPLTFKISAHLTRPDKPSCETETYKNHLKLNYTCMTIWLVFPKTVSLSVDISQELCLYLRGIYF